MAYTEDETRSELLSKCADMDGFYKRCPYRKGRLKGSEQFSDDFVAEFIKENLIEQSASEYKLKGIGKDKRREYFDRERRKILKTEGSLEEIFQRYLHFGGELAENLKAELSEEIFLWFELSGCPKIGKGIDLISYNPNKKRLSIYELKFGEVTEHLLKAVLEIETYYQRTRFWKIKTDWKKNWRNANKPNAQFDDLILNFEESSVRKVVLLDERALAYKQFVDSKNNRNTLDLIDLFKIDVIHFDGSEYTVESMNRFIFEK